MTGRWLRCLMLIALVVAVTLPTAACGRRGAPEHPPGSEYPKQYPRR